MQTNNESLVTPFFKHVAQLDPHASKREGRPIYSDMEVCEVRIAGDRNFKPEFPAHSMWNRVDGEDITYAMRWPDQYARFKENSEQVATGTPLSELPFLSEAKRQELRGLKVYTAEALAAIEGKNLSALGLSGREWKTQAAAYLSRASGSAETVRLAGEVELLKARIAEMSGVVAGPETAAEVATDSDADRKAALKDQIEAMGHPRPRGNPSVETLERMLVE